MSVTSLLNGSKPNQKEFQEILRVVIPIKKSFQTISGKEAFSKNQYEVLVPYNLVKNYNSSVVGTAFDYLARIMLSRVVKKNRSEAYSDISAEHGLIILLSFLKNHRTLKSKIEKRFKKSVKRLKKYSNNKKPINQLAKDACFLAKFDHILRSGLPPANIYEKSFFSDPDEEILRDLDLLCDVFQKEFIPKITRSNSEIIYNPNFGVSSAFVGGADGDVIIDGTLYDFKTGKNVGYRWKEVAQIVGYYLLNELSLEVMNLKENHSIDGSYRHLDIKRIAFYRARYGEVEYIDISYFDKFAIEKAKKDLAAYFVRSPNMSRPMIENLHILKGLANT